MQQIVSDQWRESRKLNRWAIDRNFYSVVVNLFSVSRCDEISHLLFVRRKFAFEECNQIFDAVLDSSSCRNCIKMIKLATIDEKICWMEEIQ